MFSSLFLLINVRLVKLARPAVSASPLHGAPPPLHTLRPDGGSGGVTGCGLGGDLIAEWQYFP
ncbi:hypothetical protein [Janthinobacterium violaceinigrum]|uniref:Uncharacterized protein n=1 Tax=Janthinobacterium violaceinigrum TaxID=2654252 RepID=A0A6I1I214_9BURK|nr:hypothetical protein [Janthinobacterium violaceinigrum]KAB8061817.1 hypothetical protein GCN75_22905 [Janthinobacterium violaceinigrum]